MSKATLIGEVIEREVRDILNAFIVDLEPNLDAKSWLKNHRSDIASNLRHRIERKYIALEIIDSATWHPRKVGREQE